MWLQIWVQQQSESSPLHPTQKYQRFSWRVFFFFVTQPVGKISVILQRIVEFSWQAQLHFEFKTQVHPSRLLNCQSWASKLFLCLAALQTVSVDALILCKSWVGRSFCVHLTEYPCVRRGFVLTLWFPPPVIKIVLNTKEKALLFFPFKKKDSCIFSVFPSRKTSHQLFRPKDNGYGWLVKMLTCAVLFKHDRSSVLEVL